MRPALGAFDIFIASLHALIFVVGVKSNLVVIICFMLRPKLRTPQNVFIINLAAADLTLLSLIPVRLTAHLQGRQHSGMAECIATAALIEMACLGSILNIMAIGVVRYISIVHPWLKPVCFTWRVCALTQLGIYIYATVILLPSHIGGGTYSFSEGIHNCTFDWQFSVAYRVISTILVFAVPVIVLVYCYFRIYFRVRKSHARVTRSRSRSQTLGSRSPRLGNDIQLAKQLLVVFIVFTVCWMPYIIISLIDPSERLSPVFYEILSVLIQLNSTLNAPIYFYFNKVFRTEMLLLCPSTVSCVKCRGPVSTVQDNPDAVMSLASRDSSL